MTSFLYHEHLNYHGGALKYWDVHDDQQWTLVASEALVIKVVEHQPDVVLVVSGLTYHRRTFDLLARLDVPLALMFTESPYGDRRQRLMLEHC
ncbi:MAG: hypothetical protein GTO22_20700, partial [Gemmatimonadales bacterium]|nr:hypothetical protein [Gemmatimonadales bacterium]